MLAILLIVAAGAQAPPARGSAATEQLFKEWRFGQDPTEPAAQIEISGADGKDKVGLSLVVHDVLLGVQQFRGLSLKGTLRVAVVDDAAFSAALAASETGRSRELLQRLWRAWSAFGIVPPLMKSNRSDDRAVLGFYDPARKQLFVRRSQAGGSKNEREERLREVLAHEIEHAIQFSNFAMPDLESMADDDERLALKAVLEGEATYVEMGYRAQRLNLAVRPAVEAFAQVEHEATLNGLVRAAAPGDPAALPQLVQDYLTLQYVDGLGYVSQVHRFGGKFAVNTLLRDPPKDSRSIMTASGTIMLRQRPASPAPAIAGGIESGTLGALPARALFTACGAGRDAQRLALAIDGDAYALTPASGSGRAVLWRALFQNEETAALAERVLTQGTCGPVNVKRSGASLALGRGIDAPVPVPYDARMAHAKAPAPPSWRAHDQRAFVINGIFVSPSMGIRANFPPSLKVSYDRDDVEFDVYGGAAGITATLIPEPATPQRLRSYFTDVQNQMFKEFQAQGCIAEPLEITLLGDDRPAARYRCALDDDGPNRTVHAVPVSICNGRAFVGIQMSSFGRGSAAAEAYLTNFLLSMKWEGTPAACADLK